MYILKNKSMNEIIDKFNIFLKDIDNKINIISSDDEFNTK